MSAQFSIHGEYSAEDIAALLAPLWPGVELTGYIVIGFDGSMRPVLSSNAGSVGQIIAGLSACLYALTSHDLNGDPAQPDDMMEIPYRSGAETKSLACPGCGCIGWGRTPGGIRCGGCGNDYDGAELRAMLDRAGDGS